MDDTTRQQWKWKFYRTALHLNAVILSVALTVLAAILAPESFRLLSVLFLLIIDIFLVYTFRVNYHATKAWLDEHGSSKKSG